MHVNIVTFNRNIVARQSTNTVNASSAWAHQDNLCHEMIIYCEKD